jgi:hypothetical protein
MLCWRQRHCRPSAGASAPFPRASRPPAGFVESLQASKGQGDAFGACESDNESVPNGSTGEKVGTTLRVRRLIKFVRSLGCKTPPATARCYSVFESLSTKKTLLLREVVQVAGTPDAWFEAAAHLFVYRLEDDSRIWVGTSDLNRVDYIDWLATGACRPRVSATSRKRVFGPGDDHRGSEWPPFGGRWR